MGTHRLQKLREKTYVNAPKTLLRRQTTFCYTRSTNTFLTSSCLALAVQEERFADRHVVKNKAAVQLTSAARAQAVEQHVEIQAVHAEETASVRPANVRVKWLACV